MPMWVQIWLYGAGLITFAWVLILACWVAVEGAPSIYDKDDARRALLQVWGWALTWLWPAVIVVGVVIGAFFLFKWTANTAKLAFEMGR